KMGLERLSQFPKKRPFPKPAFLFSCKKKRVLDAQKKKRQQSFGAFFYIRRARFALSQPQAPLPLMQTMQNCTAAKRPPPAGANLLQPRRPWKTVHTSARMAGAAAKYNAQTIQGLRAAKLFPHPQ
ncbi:MAG: hypothetical protein IKC04_03270, partial [Oscillospiraceae bacterium]|nr:hypothetical protein [Oscillospiraceae bacterium]MBR2977568.1 hypothetical protein [Oscillospiraceae bacterium]